MKAVILYITILSAAALLPQVRGLRGMPDGLRAVDVSIDDSKDDWPMIVGGDSPWATDVETDDMLIGWSTRKKKDFVLRWNSDLESLGEFLCDNVGEEIYLLVENHRNDEGLRVKVDVTDDEDWCD